MPRTPAPAITDEAIVEHLRAGLSAKRIAMLYRVGANRVNRVRKAHGIDPHPPGPISESAEAMFVRKTAAQGDCLIWQGCDLGMPLAPGLSLSAARYAFSARYGRRPIGKVLPSCGTHQCVAADHIEDRVMRERREQLAAALGI